MKFIFVCEVLRFWRFLRLALDRFRQLFYQKLAFPCHPTSLLVPKIRRFLDCRRTDSTSEGRDAATFPKRRSQPQQNVLAGAGRNGPANNDRLRNLSLFLRINLQQVGQEIEQMLREQQLRSTVRYWTFLTYLWNQHESGALRKLQESTREVTTPFFK